MVAALVPSAIVRLREIRVINVVVDDDGSGPAVARSVARAIAGAVPGNDCGALLRHEEGRRTSGITHIGCATLAANVEFFVAAVIFVAHGAE